MKAKILTILNLCLCLLMIQQVHSQTDEVGYYKAPLSNDTSRYRARNSDFLYHVSTGGNFSLQVGSYTYIECSPHAAYHFNKWVSVGLNFSYSYLRYNLQSNHIVGGGTFAEFYFLKYLALHAEYLLLNYDNIYAINPKDPRRIYSHNLLLGGGYYQKINESYAVYFLALYPISNRPQQPFLSFPVFKVGFTFWPKYL
jgi:hypothetical protein